MDINSENKTIPKPSNSWLGGTCSVCGYPVVMTQGLRWDYRYYCSNPDCTNHTAHLEDDLGDQEDKPKWVIEPKRESP